MRVRWCAVQEGGEEGEAPRPAGEKMLRNQFNFTERAAQTYNNPLRVRSTPLDYILLPGSCTHTHTTRTD